MAGSTGSVTCACGCGEASRYSARYGRALYILGHQALKSHKPYRVDRETGCWIWLRAVRDGTGGYGAAYRNGRRVSAHAMYYEDARGPVPNGCELDHLCRNTLCVNPDHLEPVPHAVNVQRGAKARLTWGDVRQIRDGDETVSALARRFGVSRRCIQHVRSGRTWKESDPVR
jgi:hypothetical protein